MSGMVWVNPTLEELCDLMCGKPEEEIYGEDSDEHNDNTDED